MVLVLGRISTFKKVFTSFLTACLVFSLAACSTPQESAVSVNTTESTTESATKETTTQNQVNVIEYIPSANELFDAILESNCYSGDCSIQDLEETTYDTEYGLGRYYDGDPENIDPAHECYARFEPHLISISFDLSYKNYNVGVNTLSLTDTVDYEEFSDLHIRYDEQRTFVKAEFKYRSDKTLRGFSLRAPSPSPSQTPSAYTIYSLLLADCPEEYKITKEEFAAAEEKAAKGDPDTGYTKTDDDSVIGMETVDKNGLRYEFYHEAGHDECEFRILNIEKIDDNVG